MVFSMTDIPWPAPEACQPQRTIEPNSLRRQRSICCRRTLLREPGADLQRPKWDGAYRRHKRRPEPLGRVHCAASWRQPGNTWGTVGRDGPTAVARHTPLARRQPAEERSLRRAPGRACRHAHLQGSPEIGRTQLGERRRGPALPAPGVGHRRQRLRRQALERLLLGQEPEVRRAPVGGERHVDARHLERRPVEMRRLGRAIERDNASRRKSLPLPCVPIPRPAQAMLYRRACAIQLPRARIRPMSASSAAPTSPATQPRYHAAVRQDWLDTRQRDLEPDLPIVDPHHHLWDGPVGRYLLDELLADTGSGHNVVATVFLQCGAMYGPTARRSCGRRRDRVRQRRRRHERQRRLRPDPRLRRHRRPRRPAAGRAASSEVLEAHLARRRRALPRHPPHRPSCDADTDVLGPPRTAPPAGLYRATTSAPGSPLAPLGSQLRRLAAGAAAARADRAWRAPSPTPAIVLDHVGTPLGLGSLRRQAGGDVSGSGRQHPGAGEACPNVS